MLGFWLDSGLWLSAETCERLFGSESRRFECGGSGRFCSRLPYGLSGGVALYLRRVRVMGSGFVSVGRADDVYYIYSVRMSGYVLPNKCLIFIKIIFSRPVSIRLSSSRWARAERRYSMYFRNPATNGPRDR